MTRFRGRSSFVMRARTMLSIVAVGYHLSAHIQWRFETRRHVLPSSSIVSDGIRVMGIAIVVSRTALGRRRETFSRTSESRRDRICCVTCTIFRNCQ